MSREKIKPVLSFVQEEPFGVRVTPERRKLQQGRTVFFPGLGETVKEGGAFSEPAKAYAELTGEEVLAPQDPKASEELSHEDVVEKLEERKIHAREYFKQSVAEETLEAVLNTIPLGQFKKALYAMQFLESSADAPVEPITKVVAHSQGGVVGPLCALLWPEYFKDTHFVLMNPAGWSASPEKGEQLFVAASERVKKSRLEILKNAFAETPSFVRYYASLIASGNVRALLNSLFDGFASGRMFQRLDEARELLHYDAVPLLQLLAHTGSKITVAYGEKDALFLKKNFKRRLQKTPDIEGREVSGGHFEILKHPRKVSMTLQELFLGQSSG